MPIKIKDTKIHSKYEDQIYTYIISVETYIGNTPIIFTSYEYELLKPYIDKKGRLSKNLNVIGNIYDLKLINKNRLISEKDLISDKRIFFKSLLKINKEGFFVEYKEPGFSLKANLNFNKNIPKNIQIGNCYTVDTSNYTFTTEG